MREVCRPPVLPVLLFFLLLPHPSAAAGLRYQALPLPGAVTRWDQVSIEESAKMDDVEGLVEVLTVIPALLERRELRVFLGRSGGFAPEPLVLPLDASVLSIEAGPPGAPVVALTDDGLSALRFKSGGLSWESLFEERSVLSGTGTFVPNLGLVHDLDGDGRADVLFPTPEGASVHLSGAQGLSRQPASRVRFPLDDLQPEGGSSLSRLYPLPEVRDLTGDGLPELVLRDPQRGWGGLRVLRNLGGGRFADAVAPLPPLPQAAQTARRGAWREGTTRAARGGDGRPEIIFTQRDDNGLGRITVVRLGV